MAAFDVCISTMDEMIFSVKNTITYWKWMLAYMKDWTANTLHSHTVKYIRTTYINMLVVPRQSAQHILNQNTVFIKVIEP